VITMSRSAASRAGWRRDRRTVLHFWNVQRRRVAEAEPNAAHLVLKDLERFHPTAGEAQGSTALECKLRSIRDLH
jgi:NAD-dependent deacetylase